MTHDGERWTILDPVVDRAAVSGRVARHPALGRQIRGVEVGFEVDYPWASYLTVLDEWEALWRADAAEVNSYPLLLDMLGATDG